MNQLKKIPFLIIFCSCLYVGKSYSQFLPLNTRISENENNIRSSLPFPYERYITPQKRPSQDPEFSLGIAISGGGTRAQAFGFGVLLGLETIAYRDSSNMLKEIDYFSTVSGGSFAAGTYFTELNQFNNHPKQKIFSLNGLYKEGVDSSNEMINYFSRVGESYAISNVFSTAFNANKKRMERIEEVHKYILFNNSTDKYDTLKFNQIFIPLKQSIKNVKLPWLFLNTTIYPKFTRMVFLPYSLRKDLWVSKIIDIEGYSPIDLPLDNNLSISYGIVASSAFPIFTPMFHFSPDPFSKDSILNLIDGGVTDNFGILRLMEALKKDNVKNRKFHLIVDCSGKADFTHLYAHDDFIHEVGNIALATVDGRYFDFYDSGVDSLLPDSSSRCLLNLRCIISSLSRKSIDSIWNSNDSIMKAAREVPFNFEFGFFQFLLLSLQKDKVKIPQDEKGELRPDLIELSEYIKISPRSRILLFELVSNVGTKLEIKQVEVEALILMGKYAVYSKTKELTSKINKKD